MDNNKPPQYQSGFPNYFTQFSSLNPPQKHLHDQYGKQFPQNMQNLTFMQKNQALDSNGLKFEKNEFDDFVDIQHQQQQNNFYNFNDVKEIQQQQYQLPPAQIQNQDFSMFTPYQPPYIDIFDQYMGDQGPKKENIEQFHQNNNFEDNGKYSINQPPSYMIPVGHPKQEDTDFKFNYNPQNQFSQNHFNALSDINMQNNFGRQATAILDDLISNNFKPNNTPFYNQAPPNNLDQISQIHMLLQNPALLQGMHQGIQQKYSQGQPQSHPLPGGPQSQFYNQPMIPPQAYFQQPYFMNNPPQKNFYMQPPQSTYQSQVQNNYQPLMQVQYPQQPPVPQFQQQMNQTPPYNYQFQPQQMIKKEDKNEEQMKGQNLFQQVNKNIMQNYHSFDQDQQLIPNSNNLKYLISDGVNGPFSAQNIKKTDIFISKFLDFSNLKKIKDGLTKELIQYFSSMNLEDLLNFQSKNLLIQRSSNPIVTRKIGQLTFRERQLKIAKYKQKRRNRQWDKKINYDCRKQVADKRERIKGRFVTKNQESLLQEYKRQIQKIEHNQQIQQPEKEIDEVPHDESLSEVQKAETSYKEEYVQQI